MKRFLLFFFILFSFSLQAFHLEYGLDAKRGDDPSLKKIKIFSERCSGSNYTRSLICANLPLENSFYFGHKHFPPWLDLPPESFKGPRHLYTFEGNEDTLFVVVFRSPYDWLRSLRKKPWHAVQSLWHIPFSQFIRRPWVIDVKNKEIAKLYKFNPLIDKDPLTGKNFDNVMKLRTAKIGNMLKIKERVDNIYIVNYETVRDHPQEVIQEIGRFFGLTPHPSFTPITEYKGEESQGEYKPKQYKPIKEEDLRFINSQLDETTEALLGYPLIHRVEEIDKEVLTLSE